MTDTPPRFAPEPSPLPQADPIRLGPFVFERASLRLLRDGVDTGTDAQQLKLLGVLIDAWPGVVSKDELLDKIWGGHVSEAALHKTVSLLRKQLHTLGDGAEFIRTRHRHGYQLLVAPVAMDATLPAASSVSPPAPRYRIVAALIGAVLLVGIFVWISLRPTHPQPAPASQIHEAPAPVPLESLAERDDTALLQLARDATPSDLILAAAAADTLRARVDAKTQPGLVGLAHKQAGLVAYHRGEYAHAVALFEAALAPLQAAEDWAELANVLGNIGASWVELGDVGPQPVTRYREALAIWMQRDDASGLSRTYNNLVNLHLKRGNLDEAQRDLDALANIVSELDDPVWDVRVDILRGDVLGAGAQPGAQDAYAQALDRATRSAQPALAAVAAQRLARMAEQSGDVVLAYRWLTQARQHYEAAGSRGQLPFLDYALAGNRERAGLADEAIAHYHAVLAALAPQASPALRADTQTGIARLLMDRGEREAAQQRLEHAARDARLSGDPLAVTSVLIGQGFHLLAAGESAVAALALAREAEAALGTRESWSHRRNILALSGLTLAANEHVDEALSKARQLREEAARHNDLSSLTQADTVEAAAHLMRGDFAPGYQALRRSRADANLLESASVVTTAMPDTATRSKWPWLVALLLVPLAFVMGRLSR